MALKRAVVVCFLVREEDSSPPRQTADGGLGDALDVVSQHLTVTLGASLSESLASLATSGHVAGVQ